MLNISVGYGFTSRKIKKIDLASKQMVHHAFVPKWGYGFRLLAVYLQVIRTTLVIAVYLVKLSKASSRDINSNSNFTLLPSLCKPETEDQIRPQ